MNRFDLLVIGAGPAGASAALAASEAGLATALIDEAEQPGGQVYRAVPAEFRGEPAHSGDAATGDALRAAVARSAIDTRPGRRVWSVGPGFRVDALLPDASECMFAPRLIAATGAHERIVPFPGWTLPGVIGLAAATILLKSQRMLPGRRVVVAGCGPLLAAVAAKIVRAGGTVAAVVDLCSPADWLSAMPAMASRPALLAEGAGWVLALAGARVPVHFRHGVRRAHGDPALEGVTIGPVGADGAPVEGREQLFEADALTVGHGLTPGSDIPRLLRAKHRFEAARGGWVPVVDEEGRCDIDGLFAVGDGAGIAGAVPAALRGRLAGLAAAHDAGRLDAADFAREAAPVRRDLQKAMRFAGAVNRMIAPRPAMVRALAPEAVVCRCEDVTRGEIDAAITAGAHEVNQLKHFTRCGMGPCQGRMCGETAAELVAAAAGSREAAGQWTMRPPLRPVPLDALIGTFSYDDIPVPEPAPL